MVSEERRAYSKDYYQKNKEKIKEQSKNWKKNNKKRFNELSFKYKKKNNYKYEKTEKQREIRNIKRKTRHSFPLKINTKCKYCKEKAECHHHTTNPIEYDKFIFLCNKCHKEIHTDERRKKCFKKNKRQ